MKKILVVFSLAFVFMLSACTGTEEEVLECMDYEEIVEDECVDNRTEFELAMYNMNNSTSVKAVMTIKDFPLLGDIESTMFISDTQMQMEIMGDTLYLFEEDGVTYQLESDNDGGWTKTEAETSIEEEAATDADFLEADFDLVDGVYVANKTVEDMENLEITIVDGYITLMVFTTTEQGMSFDFEVEFSEYNTVTVELPEYE